MGSTGVANTKLFIFIKHHWLTVAFLLGFVTDYILLNRVDDKVDNFVLLFYVVLATASLLLFYVGVSEKVPPRIVNFLSKYMPMLMQYSFGGLLSGMLIFYGRSGDLLVSAPYLVLIVSVMFANELVKKRSDRLLYNIIVYFIGLFSYLVLVLPVLTGEMGGVIFIGSGLLSLLIMFLLVKTLSLIIPNFLILERRNIVFSVGCLYALFNSFYFFNIIPPIPLSLTELSIYQQVERTSAGGYRIIKEEKTLLQKMLFLTTVFHPYVGQGAYCFARVYAPTSLKTTIVHRWEYKDNNGDWQDHFTFSYSISGENKNGYRGFTKIENIHDGEWRCGVETERGQVLGRKVFTIDTKTAPSNLVTVVE